MDPHIVIVTRAIKNLVLVSEIFSIRLQVMKLKFKHLSNCARAPQRVTGFLAGYGILSAQ